MLNSFFIENFRLFRHLEIARLGRVNLLVGKNNSGKSAFLEAVELYASNASVLTMYNLVLGREETWNERSESLVSQTNDNSIRHLFLGHQLPKVGEKGIDLGSGKDKSDRLRIQIAAYQTHLEDDVATRRKILTQKEALEAQEEVLFGLIVMEGTRIRRFTPMDKLFASGRTRAAIFAENDLKYTVQTVPTQNMTARKIASLWDLIGLSDLAEEVVSGLKLILPSITGIGFVESDRTSNAARVALVRTNDSSEPLPLKSMGDGMTRLFHIIVALVNAKDGIVLIDEFENGLHWSVQRDIWKTVFRLAIDLNVQVFATTHSRDCVTTYEDAWKEYQNEGAFFRLQMSKDGISLAQEYSIDTLADSLETEVEMR